MPPDAPTQLAAAAVRRHLRVRLTTALERNRALVAAILLTVIVVLAVQHYAGLLGVPPGDPAAWVLPASYGVVAVVGLGWGLILKARRPDIYAAIGLGAHAVTGRLTAFSQDKDVTR